MLHVLDSERAADALEEVLVLFWKALADCDKKYENWFEELVASGGQGNEGLIEALLEEQFGHGRFDLAQITHGKDSLTN